MSVKVTYEGETILEVLDEVSKTLKTAGKYCDDDIVIENTPDEAVIEALTVTENGTYTAPEGVDGFSPITVNVPNPSSGSIEITENGTYDVTEKASAVVNVSGGGATEPYREDTLDADGNIVDVVLHGYTKIPTYFLSNASIESIDLDGVTDIGESAFVNCESLYMDEISISGSMDYNAFNSCKGLAEKFKIKCKNMGVSEPAAAKSMFRYCTNLKKVWLSKNIENILTYNAANACTFAGCTNLKHIYTDADSKPSGWGQYFNSTGTSTTATVHYGVSEAEFDAL